MTVLGELHFSGGDDNTSLTILLAFNNSKEKGQGEGNLYKIHHTICAKPYMDSESHKRYRIYYTVRIHIVARNCRKWAYVTRISLHSPRTVPPVIFVIQCIVSHYGTVNSQYY